MKDIFVINDVPYSLRSGNDLLQPNAKTTKFGTETTPFIGYKLWQMLQNEIKTASSLAFFQKPNKIMERVRNATVGFAEFDLNL